MSELEKSPYVAKANVVDKNHQDHVSLQESRPGWNGSQRRRRKARDANAADIYYGEPS